MVRDPFAEKYPSLSPYNYCANNPLVFVDPDGKKITVYSREVMNSGRNHLFAVVQHSGSKTQTIYSLKGDNFIKGGGASFLVNYQSDVDALNSGNTVEQQIIAVPEGMTEMEYDVKFTAKLLEIASEFESNYPSLDENILEIEGNINSNSFIDRAVEESGGVIQDFGNTPLQNSRLPEQNSAPISDVNYDEFSQSPDQGQSGGGNTGSGGGGLPTVICTELHRQGLLSGEIFEADKLFGANLRKTNPSIFNGYLILAKPIVKAMQSGGLVGKITTNVVKLFALPWAEQMAYEIKGFGDGSTLGKIVMGVGMPICEMVGTYCDEKRGVLLSENNSAVSTKTGSAF